MTKTPNLKLEEIQANRRTWADLMNDNLLLIDAAIGAYFTLQNLQGIWENSHEYEVGQTVVDGETAAVWTCQVDHISAGIPTTFAEERTSHVDYWTVYSSPARARGAWEPLTSYAVNDFVVSGSQYAVCIATHTSSVSFSNDVALGRWSILVDLSQVGQQVLPVLNGAADANKFVITNAAGTGYGIRDQAATLAALGATSYGIALLQAASQAAARSAINAQVSGNYQTTSAYLTAIATLTIVADTFPYFDGSGVAAVAAITSFGRSLIDDANASAARSTLGLGTAAVANTGTSADNIPVLDGSAKMPAVDGSALTNLTATNLTGAVPRANGGAGSSVAAPVIYTNSAYSYNSGANIPGDDSIPLITEGVEIVSGTFTAATSTNRIRVEFDGMLGVGADLACVALFIDGATNAVRSKFFRMDAGFTYSATLVWEGTLSAGSHTFAIRGGTNSIGLAINGTNSARVGGGSTASTLRISELPTT